MMREQLKQKETGLIKMEFRGISRRSFLKFCAATAALLGLESSYGSIFAAAAEEAIKKKPVIWLQGQGCTGCSASLLSSLNPGPAEILLDMISMRFNTTVMNGTGHVSVQVLEETFKEGNYLLAIEGSIPTEDSRYCIVEGMGFKELVLKAAKNAEAVVAVGTCATYGGIPRAGLTGAVGVSEIISDKPVVNIAGCPMNPSWLMGTLLYYLSFQELPALDKTGRPLAYYGNHNIHETCPRVSYYENGQFLVDWNDPATSNWCLLLAGCKGPVTYADCNRNWWNDGVSNCIRSGAPCAGCVQPQFYKDFSPLYAPLFTPVTGDKGGEKPAPAPAEPAAQTGGLDAKSVLLGVGIAAAPLVANKVANSLKNKKGEVKRG
ncbi:MAG: hydrogenase small subunit [Bacillota bacterium]